MKKRSFQKDNHANTMVIEAILAAMIIISAVIFFNVLKAPNVSQGETSIDTASFALETMDVLRTRPASNGTLYDNLLEEIVTLALSGDSETPHEIITDILPEGAKYVLRLDNGFGELHLLPDGRSEIAPLAARGAVQYITPSWTTNEAIAPALPAMEPPVLPGFQIPYDTNTNTYDPTWATALQFTSSVACIVSPSGDVYTGNGANYAPDQETWVEIWQQQAGVIPKNIPLGTWAASDNTDPNCLNPILFIHVGMDKGDNINTLDPYTYVKPTENPIYGVQLVVWYGN